MAVPLNQQPVVGFKLAHLATYDKISLNQENRSQSAFESLEGQGPPTAPPTIVDLVIGPGFIQIIDQAGTLLENWNPSEVREARGLSGQMFRNILGVEVASKAEPGTVEVHLFGVMATDLLADSVADQINAFANAGAGQQVPAPSAEVATIAPSTSSTTILMPDQSMISPLPVLPVVAAEVQTLPPADRVSQSAKSVRSSSGKPPLPQIKEDPAKEGNVLGACINEINGLTARVGQIDQLRQRIFQLDQQIEQKQKKRKVFGGTEGGKAKAEREATMKQFNEQHPRPEDVIDVLQKYRLVFIILNRFRNKRNPTPGMPQVPPELAQQLAMTFSVIVQFSTTYNPEQPYGLVNSIEMPVMPKGAIQLLRNSLQDRDVEAVWTPLGPSWKIPLEELQGDIPDYRPILLIPPGVIPEPISLRFLDPQLVKQLRERLRAREERLTVIRESTMPPIQAADTAMVVQEVGGVVGGSGDSLPVVVEVEPTTQVTIPPRIDEEAEVIVTQSFDNALRASPRSSQSGRQSHGQQSVDRPPSPPREEPFARQSVMPENGAVVMNGQAPRSSERRLSQSHGDMPDASSRMSTRPPPSDDASTRGHTLEHTRSSKRHDGEASMMPQQQQLAQVIARQVISNLAEMRGQESKAFLEEMQRGSKTFEEGITQLREMCEQLVKQQRASSAVAQRQSVMSTGTPVATALTEKPPMPNIPSRMTMATQDEFLQKLQQANPPKRACRVVTAPPSGNNPNKIRFYENEVLEIAKEESSGILVVRNADGDFGELPKSAVWELSNQQLHREDLDGAPEQVTSTMRPSAPAPRHDDEVEAPSRFRARVYEDYTATSSKEISLEADEEVVVEKQSSNWSYVNRDGERGWVPTSLLGRIQERIPKPPRSVASQPGGSRRQRMREPSPWQQAPQPQQVYHQPPMYPQPQFVPLPMVTSPQQNQPFGGFQNYNQAPMMQQHQPQMQGGWSPAGFQPPPVTAPMNYHHPQQQAPIRAQPLTNSFFYDDEDSDVDNV